jgi:hypothetical protein
VQLDAATRNNDFKGLLQPAWQATPAERLAIPAGKPSNKTSGKSKTTRKPGHIDILTHTKKVSEFKAQIQLLEHENTQLAN